MLHVRSLLWNAKGLHFIRQVAKALMKAINSIIPRVLYEASLGTIGCPLSVAQELRVANFLASEWERLDMRLHFLPNSLRTRLFNNNSASLTLDWCHDCRPFYKPLKPAAPALQESQASPCGALSSKLQPCRSNK